MPPTLDELTEFARQSRQRLAYEASLAATTQEDPARARADSRLRFQSSFPLPIWDDTSRQMAGIRLRQAQAAEVTERAPSLTSHLLDTGTFRLAADDLEPLANVSRSLSALQRRLRPAIAEAEAGAFASSETRTVGQQASAATARVLQQRPGLSRYRSMIERSFASFYNPRNPLNVAGRVASNAVTFANEGAAGIFEGLYDLATLRTFGARTWGDNYADELKRRGELPQNYEIDPVRRYLQGTRHEMQASRQANQIDTGSQVLDAALGGIQSIPLQLAALYTAARGNPQAALGMMASITGGQSYGEARDAGLTPSQALPYAVLQGSLEAAGEALPIFNFVEDAARGSGFFRTFGRQLLAENLGEQFTQHSQDFVQWAAIDYDRGKTLQDYLAERPRVARDTFIATTAAVGLQTQVARVILQAVQRAGEGQVSTARADGVDRLMTDAADSRLRRESPEDFRRLLQSQIEDRLDDQIYIPAEQVRELFQSPQDIADDPFWSEYSSQIEEAEALGGDIVVPLVDAVTHLAGNPQWEALKDHVRTSAGAMSRAEARQAQADFTRTFAEQAPELAREIEVQEALEAPRQRVFDAMREKLEGAGFTPQAAEQLATMFVDRAATRAARLGRELTGTEADAVDVRSGETEAVEGRSLGQAEEGGEIVGTLPPEGLAPANIGSDGRIYVGEMGEAHFNVMERYPSVEWTGGTGFVTPSGDFLNRTEALAYARSQGERIRPSENMGAELDALDYRDQSEFVPPPIWSSYRAAWDARAKARGRTRGQTSTNAFKKWFGDSKVVDEAGNPLVVYKAMYPYDWTQETDDSAGPAVESINRSTPFPAFNGTDEGVDIAGFFGDMETANRFAAQMRGVQAIYPVYLSFQNPYIIDATGEKAGNIQFGENGRAFRDVIKSGEYDSVIIENTEDEGTVYVALKPEQIKSIHNAGTFDPTDPRILNQDERGRITFTSDGKAIIDLFANRDLSTFIHETGHLYLEELKLDAQLATELDTPEGRQLFADFETVKAWFKREGHEIGADGVIPTEAHELFARGFERYAMEGKAPSQGLRRAFETFRKWLVTIYKTVRGINSPISPEIRDVMARLLATDEEIAAAIQGQAIKLGFESADIARMTSQEFAAYQRLAEDAKDEAHRGLLEKVMATVRAAKTKEFREQQAEARREVADAVDQQPMFRALAALRSKAEPVRLDRQFLLDSYGENALAQMPQSVPPIYADTNTVHPDVIAEETGFNSGDEMIRALMDLEATRQEMKAAGDKRSVRQAAIDAGTAQVMAELYGDPLNDGSIEEEARAIVHNDKQGEVFAAELRALGRQTGKRATPYRIARQWAGEKIAAGRVVDVASGSAIQRYLRAAAKSGREFEQALAKGDREGAFRHKQAQMLNNALVSASREAKDGIDIAVRRLGKLARAKTRASMDQDYLDQIHALLEQVELRPRSQVSLDEQQSYEAWATEQRAAGIDLVNEPSFAASLGKTHWSRLSVEQLLGLDETVQQIAHLGRLKQTLLDGAKRRKFEEARDELVASADGAGRGRKITSLNDPSRSLPERIKSRIRWADASMIKVEQIVDWLDGGKSNGPWNRLLFRPLADAQGAESDLMRKYTETINGLIKAIPRAQARDWKRLVDTPELINRVSPDPAVQGQPWQFGKDQIVMIAMNTGNAGNMQRLLDGYGWSEAQVQAVLNRLMTKEDWEFVQGVWDALEELKAPLFEMERRVNGVEPDAVEATAVETPYGTYRGGYFPAVYDTAYSTAAELQDQEQKVGGGAFFKATTRASATKQRAASVKRPLLLNTVVITRHLGEVIHDITHREAVIQAAKILANQQIRNAVDRRLGPEYVKAMEAWLDDVAKPGSNEARLWAPLRWVGKHLNRGISLVGLGYNVSSALIQPLGIANIMAQIGEAATLEGQATFLAHPRRTYREVTERSAEMRDRFSTMDANIAEMYAAHGGSGLRKIGPNAIVKHAYDGILYADMLITTGGWIGAFNKGLRDGLTEQEATYYADKVIRTSQGAGGAKDKSAIMRGPALIRSFYPFFSYLNALYNQQRDIGRRARNIGSTADLLEVARRSWWIVIVPPLVEALTRGDGPDEDDEETWAGYLMERVFVGNLGSLPGIGPVASAASSGWGYRASSLQRAGEGFVRGIDDVLAMTDPDDDNEPSRSFIQNIMTTLGIFTAQPLAPAGKAMQFLYDTSTGDAAPESLSDWYEGLTTGRIREDQ